MVLEKDKRSISCYPCVSITCIRFLGYNLSISARQASPLHGSSTPLTFFIDGCKVKKLI